MKTGRPHPAGGGGFEAVRWVIRDGETRVVSHSLVLAFMCDRALSCWRRGCFMRRRSRGSLLSPLPASRSAAQCWCLMHHRFCRAPENCKPTIEHVNILPFSTRSCTSQTSIRGYMSIGSTFLQSGAPLYTVPWLTLRHVDKHSSERSSGRRLNLSRMVRGGLT